MIGFAALMIDYSRMLTQQSCARSIDAHTCSITAHARSGNADICDECSCLGRLPTPYFPCYDPSDTPLPPACPDPDHILYSTSTMLTMPLMHIVLLFLYTPRAGLDFPRVALNVLMLPFAYVPYCA